MGNRKTYIIFQPLCCSFLIFSLNQNINFTHIWCCPQYLLYKNWNISQSIQAFSLKINILNTDFTILIYDLFFFPSKLQILLIGLFSAKWTIYISSNSSTPNNEFSMIRYRYYNLNNLCFEIQSFVMKSLRVKLQK